MQPLKNVLDPVYHLLKLGHLLYKHGKNRKEYKGA